MERRKRKQMNTKHVHYCIFVCRNCSKCVGQQTRPSKVAESGSVALVTGKGYRPFHRKDIGADGKLLNAEVRRVKVRVHDRRAATLKAGRTLVRDGATTINQEPVLNHPA